MDGVSFLWSRVWAPFAKRLWLVKAAERLIQDLKGSECSVLRGPAAKLVLSLTFFLSQPEGETGRR